MLPGATGCLPGASRWFCSWRSISVLAAIAPVGGAQRAGVSLALRVRWHDTDAHALRNHSLHPDPVGLGTNQHSKPYNGIAMPLDPPGQTNLNTVFLFGHGAPKEKAHTAGPGGLVFIHSTRTKR